MMNTLRPWHLSLVLHLALALVLVVVTKVRIENNDVIDVPVVYESPKDLQNLTVKEKKPKIVLKSVNITEQDLADKSTKQVFGTNRDSLTDASDKEGIDVKKGNTLAKAEDKEVLKDTDAGSLPTPTEEYLVSEMPEVLSEVKPAYPKEARDNKIEGPVVIDVLIDNAGKVRDAKVLEGEPVFRAPALEAIRKFLFRPAKTDGQAVAVRIRYTLNFKLEF